jgi:hypothetical protein
MTAVSIGKGLERVIVHSEAKRKKLASMPEIRVYDRRVIYPEWMAGMVKNVIDGKRRKRRPHSEQLTLFEGRE